MRSIGVREARQNFSLLLDTVLEGGQVVITRHGKPVVKMVAVDEQPLRFKSNKAFRRTIPPSRESAVTLVRRIRDER